MARPRVGSEVLSAKERKRAERLRRRGEREARARSEAELFHADAGIAGVVEEVERSDEALRVVEGGADEQIEFEGRLVPVERRAPMSEEDYVRHSLAFYAMGTDGERKARAERYARWRWRGYCAGKVATL